MQLPLPTGTITFLFTDIEGSTRLWESHPDAMRVAVARHDALLRQSVGDYGGYLFKTTGDGVAAAFATAAEGVAAAFAAQAALTAEPWSERTPPVVVRSRMGLHTGAAELRDGDYFGPTLNRCARLVAAGHGGQTLLSDATHELCRDYLPPDATLVPLGEHRLKDLTRPETIFALVHPALPAADSFPPLRTLDNPALPNNLPLQSTSFVGREREIAQASALLGKTRLLTLTGAGGTGKTRLSLQIAADLLGDYPDGVWQVELAALADPSLVPQTVAAAVGVREAPGQPITPTLADALKLKRLLLLLDNCEHVLQACATLTAALLRACPHVTILATSRESLNVRGEQAYRVPSLSLPDPKAAKAATAESLSPFESVRLFIDRASLVKPGFAVTNANAPAVAQLCWRLDGIPLALELAAARVRSLPVEQMLDRLDSRFRLLTGGDRSALPRQQTLRALIDWSYDLLSDKEKVLLGRLSIFAGSGTLDAAEAACGFDPIEDWEVLDLLTSLADKSLVQAEEQEEATVRYRMLETVREYAREKRASEAEAAVAETTRRFVDCFVSLAEKAEAHLSGPEQALWLDRLETEHDNLRTALDACADKVDVAVDDAAASSTALSGLRLSGALCRFWSIRGYGSEGRERTERALAARQDAKAEAGANAAMASALRGAGVLASSQGDFAPAQAWLEESLTVFREIGDKRGIASILNNLGTIAADQSDFALARLHYEESLALRRDLGDKSSIASTLNNLGTVASNMGDYVQAQARQEESLMILREVGDKRGIAHILGNLGNVASRQANYPQTWERFEESLMVFREIGDKRGIAYALVNMGNIAADQGNNAQARVHYEESLTLLREVGDKRGTAYALMGLGSVASDQGDFAPTRAYYEESLTLLREIGDKRGIASVLEGIAVIRAESAGEADSARRAAALWAAAAALRTSLGTPLSPTEQAEQDVAVAKARTGLADDAAWQAAWAEGALLTWEQAVERALGESVGLTA